MLKHPVLARETTVVQYQLGNAAEHLVALYQTKIQQGRLT